TQGETFDELLSNIYEAVEGCMSVDVQDISVSEKDKVMEIAV
ncbi:MAG: type II toxin-antitoxin system HicB family antitoxin, partial [Thermodesulfobacteriota bacterium]